LGSGPSPSRPAATDAWRGISEGELIIAESAHIQPIYLEPSRICGGISVKESLYQLGEKLTKTMVNRGANDVIALPSNVEKAMIRFSNNQITVVQSWSSTAIDLLSTFGRRKLITRFENLSGDAIDRGIEKAVGEAALMPEQEDATPPRGRRFADRLESEETNLERLRDIVSVSINAALKEGAERVAGVMTATTTRQCIISTTGAEGYDESSGYDLNVRAFGGESYGQGLSCASRIASLEPERAGTDAGRIVRLSRSAVPWSAGRHDVCLSPIIGANLTERLGNAFSAFSVEAGMSCLANRLGGRVLSDGLSIADDGSDPRNLNSRGFDDEGQPTQCNKLVENGNIAAYLHNSSTARRFNTSTTGNAGWIAPGAWNLIVQPGKIPEDELLGELRNGIFIVSNWYTRFQNYSTGDFSTICRDGAFLVEGGEIKGAIKGARISDNLLRVFSSVRGTGARRQWVHWWEVNTPVLLPVMIASGVTLTKAQEA